MSNENETPNDLPVEASEQAETVEATTEATPAVEAPVAETKKTAPAAKGEKGCWRNAIEASQLKQDLPAVHPGDTVKVKVMIREGNKERPQAFEGIVLKLSGSGVSRTMTVRKVFQGIGVERVFLLHSPRLASIEVLRRGRVRRAKLYYLRDLRGKAARIKEKTTGTAKNFIIGSKKDGSKKNSLNKEAVPV